MGQDDETGDRDDPEHVWLLETVEFRLDGSWSEYRCERCGMVTWVAPGGVHPAMA